MSLGKEHRLRRFAIQIVQQMPENKAEAMLVLEYARELVLWENPDSGIQIVELVTKLVG